MIEILCDGIVHYRRPDNHPDVAEARELIKKGCTLYSIRKVTGETNEELPETIKRLKKIRIEIIGLVEEADRLVFEATGERNKIHMSDSLINTISRLDRMSE